MSGISNERVARQGFTLIELLVVIAIIASPTFATGSEIRLFSSTRMLVS